VSVSSLLTNPIDASALEAATGGTVVHTYKQVFNGASMVLPGTSVGDLADIEGVTGVYLDELLQPDTEHSPQFIGAPGVWDAWVGKEAPVKASTVAILDTGVWPDTRRSLTPIRPVSPMRPRPFCLARMASAGAPRSTCNFGNTGYNPMDAPSSATIS